MTSFVLTIAFHPEDQARFEALRQRFFPPALNRVPAHLTLFHTVTDPAAAAILHLVAQRQSCFAVAITGLRSLGRGVAYTAASPDLLQLRAALARHWHDTLTAQDRQGYRPHMTIQNKAAPQEAAALLAMLQAGFTPFEVRAEGLLLWAYRGGPWELVERFGFAAAQ